MKHYFAMVVCVAAAAAFGAADDTLVTFSTRGPDVYLDGSPVRDGECYALVWTRRGATFAGLAADGSAVGADSKVLVYAPLAKGGRCPPTIFELDAELAKQYRDGSFAVYLVDTRLASGKLGGVNAAGLPVAVNGWGSTVGEATSSSLQNKDGSSSNRSDGDVASPTVRVTTRSALPANTPKPQITAIRVVGDKVFLTVKNTLPCLQYKANEVRVSSQTSQTSQTTFQGSSSPDAEITVIAPVKGNSGLYSVGRD